MGFSGVGVHVCQTCFDYGAWFGFLVLLVVPPRCEDMFQAFDSFCGLRQNPITICCFATTVERKSQHQAQIQFYADVVRRALLRSRNIVNHNTFKRHRSQQIPTTCPRITGDRVFIVFTCDKKSKYAFPSRFDEVPPGFSHHSGYLRQRACQSGRPPRCSRI